MLDQDHPEVRIFTLADHAVVAPDGKLYMNGAGVDQFFLQALPQPISPLYVALRVRIPWRMTGEPHSLSLRVLDGDRAPVAADPLVKVDFELGRAPGQRPGDEMAISLAFPVVGVVAQAEGTLYFHLHLEEETLAVLPLKLARHPGSPAPPGPPARLP